MIAERLRAQLARQADTHAAALKEATGSGQSSSQAKITRLEQLLEQSQSQLSALDERENALISREQAFRSQVQEAARTQAAQMLESEASSE